MPKRQMPKEPFYGCMLYPEQIRQIKEDIEISDKWNMLIQKHINTVRDYFSEAMMGVSVGEVKRLHNRTHNGGQYLFGEKNFLPYEYVTVTLSGEQHKFYFVNYPDMTPREVAQAIQDDVETLILA